jgi:predicted GH43/DUF377 family glycosyl hydrolase
MNLRRHPGNPILKPDPSSEWETYNVFNPAVIHHNGLFHMHYRAQGLDWVSRIGYAVSEDAPTMLEASRIPGSRKSTVSSTWHIPRMLVKRETN